MASAKPVAVAAVLGLLAAVIAGVTYWEMDVPYVTRRGVHRSRWSASEEDKAAAREGSGDITGDDATGGSGPVVGESGLAPASQPNVTGGTAKVADVPTSGDAGAGSGTDAGSGASTSTGVAGSGAGSATRLTDALHAESAGRVTADGSGSSGSSNGSGSGSSSSSNGSGSGSSSGSSSASASGSSSGSGSGSGGGSGSPAASDGGRGSGSDGGGDGGATSEAGEASDTSESRPVDTVGEDTAPRSGSTAATGATQSGSGDGSPTDAVTVAATGTPVGRCPQPASVEPIVSLKGLSRAGWPHPKAKSVRYGKCLGKSPAPRNCYCAGSAEVRRIEAALQTQPGGVFRISVGASPKYGIQLTDKLGSRAVWKPWSDGLAEYLSYKVAQILGICTVPPVVPMALDPPITKLWGNGVYQRPDPRGTARLKEATQKGGKSGKLSFGVAVYMVPGVIEYMYFHKLQCAYGFGPRVCEPWTNKRRVWPIKDGDYAWWDAVSAGRVTEAPWLANLTRASENGTTTSGGAVASASTSGAEGKARRLASGGAAVRGAAVVAVPEVVHAGRGLGGAASARRLHGGIDEWQRRGGGGGRDKEHARRRMKARQRKKKKKGVAMPAVRPLRLPGGTPQSRARQVKDLFADVSDQQVLDMIVQNPDRNRNHHVTKSRCGARVTIDLANAAVFHPETRGKDKYMLTAPKFKLHNGVGDLCKFRRSTVARLRQLAKRVPRDTLLKGTTVGVKDKFTGGTIKRRSEYPQAPKLCLLAGELAASVPAPLPLKRVRNGTSILWYARAQLRDGSSLEALCDRLDTVLRHVDGCIKRRGEALVMGELDDATPPCSGTCNFHTTTSTGTAKRRG